MSTLSVSCSQRSPHVGKHLQYLSVIMRVVSTLQTLSCCQQHTTCTGVGLARQPCSAAAALEKKPLLPPDLGLAAVGLRPAADEGCCRFAAAVAAFGFAAGVGFAMASAASFMRSPLSKLPS